MAAWNHAGGAALDEIEGSGIFSDGPNGVDMNSVLLTPVSVTTDNISETVIADGFRTWDEICVDDFEQYCPADR